jgi:uroporphyrinogen decarboxylase
MENLERFITVLDLRIPDKVPIFVQSLLPAFEEKCRSLLSVERFRALRGRNGILDFSVHRALGIEGGLARGDSALVPNLEGPLRVKAGDLTKPSTKAQLGGHRFVDFYGRIMETAPHLGGGTTWYVGPYLQSEEDFDNWDHLYARPLAQEYVEDLLETMGAGRELGFLPVPICQGLYAKATEMFGLGPVTRMCRRNPVFLERVLDRLLEIKLDIIDQYHALDVPVVVVSDDIALKDSTFLSPQDYDRFFVPRLRRITERADSYRIRTILHSDGYVTPLIPGVIRAGFNAIECLEPGAGVDLAEVKREYGKRICLIGNIDVPHLLARETLEGVRGEVKRILEIGMPGGAFSLCPAGDLLGECRVENVQEIASVRNRLGAYP